jgi:hypothetical protein
MMRYSTHLPLFILVCIADVGRYGAAQNCIALYAYNTSTCYWYRTTSDSNKNFAADFTSCLHSNTAAMLPSFSSMDHMNYVVQNTPRCVCTVNMRMYMYIIVLWTYIHTYVHTYMYV